MRHSGAVPSLTFYAAGEDRSAVLDAAFGLGVFRVFEAYSEPDRELREFHAPEEVPDTPAGWHLMLHTAGAGPDPAARRIDLRPGALGDATFRYQCEGWGLIQLHFGRVFGERDLCWSHTNHNTEKRAVNWAPVYPGLGTPASWDFAAVTRASGRLNRAIRKLAVRTLGPRPVLPVAERHIADAGLRYEYGDGVHATPSIGMTGDRPS